MKRTELKRKTPLKSKSARPRTRKPAARCAYGPRCKKQPRVIVGPEERYCPGHATQVADKLVGDYVKERDLYRCQLTSFNDSPCYEPSVVYWCHLIPKGRYYATRWVPVNAVTGCAGHHKSFDTNPLERDEWCRDRLGAERWDSLRVQAMAQKSVDVAEVIQRFRAV